MTDVHDHITRSHNMRQIRSKDTEPEMIVRKRLFSIGFRFRLHKKGMPGKPDIVLPKYKTIINVNGCFWHGHKECKYFKLPETRHNWWKEKIISTIARDKKNNGKLKLMGWNIIDVWECELKGEVKEKTLSEISNKILCQN